MNKARTTAALFAVLLFICGVVIGVLGDRYYSTTSVVARNPHAFRQRYINEMRSKLDLTPEQVGKLQAIMDKTKTEYDALRESTRPQMLKIKQEHIAEVKAILTPEQVPKYDRLIADHERRGHDGR